MVRVAINGFGRIGRAIFRLSLQEPDIKIVAINDIASVENLAYLLKYDSIHGPLDASINTFNKSLIVNDEEIPVYNQSKARKIPWKNQKIDVAVESTGTNNSKKRAKELLSAGSKKVMITALPVKSDRLNIPILISGVNVSDYSGEPIVSAGCCSALCAAPVVKLIHEEFKIQSGVMSCIHAYTKIQNLLDAPHRRFRAGRAAGVNIIPLPSNAAEVTAQLIPGLAGRLKGSSIRVPVADGSLMEFSCQLERPVASVEEVNSVIKNSSKKGLVEYTEEPLVSRDIINNTSATIFDASCTMLVPPSFIKVSLWFDHEYGYAAHCLKLIKRLMS